MLPAITREKIIIIISIEEKVPTILSASLAASFFTAIMPGFPASKTAQDLWKISSVYKYEQT